MTGKIDDLSPIECAESTVLHLCCEICGNGFVSPMYHMSCLCPICAEEYFEICPDCGYLKSMELQSYPKCSMCIRRSSKLHGAQVLAKVLSPGFIAKHTI